jgi:large subunit ribosomal protein L35
MNVRIVFSRCAANHRKRRKMPKLKTKSGAKKRFSLTASGKVRANQAGKQHGMIKRTKKQIRNLRGTTTLSDQDARIVKQFLPYA